MIRRFWRLHVLFWSVLGLPAVLAAQQTGAQSAADAAQTTVARLSYLEGEARVTAADKVSDPADAALNMPVWPGQSLQTGRNGAGEIEFADGSVLRVTENSAATLLRLQPQTEIGLDDGLYYLELRAGGRVQFTVFTGEVSVAPLENASFRIRVANGQPEIAVLRGSVTVTRANSYTVDLASGESLRSDPKNNRRYLLSDGVAQESWDHWNEGRAQQLLDASAAQTIAREDYAGGQGAGWNDLDASGTWYAMPGEGLVWQPYGAGAGFDPYGYGSWVYGSAGYVWASGYPWGWLPYRCGRWSFFPGFGWAWQPAYGCRTYGGGGWAGWGGGGGFPVNHPPRGWRPPQMPPKQFAGDSGIHIKRPTIPVRPMDGSSLTRSVAGGDPRRAQPVQVGDIVLRPLLPIASPLTPHGGSAVGSALRSDFPVENATHRPEFGREGNGMVAVPGHLAEWRAVTTNRPANVPAGSPSASGGVTPSPAVAPVGGGAAMDTLPAWRRGIVTSTLHTGTPVSDAPAGASAKAPMDASGAASIGAAGPAPTGETGASSRPGHDLGGNPTVQTLGGAGATPYNRLSPPPTVRQPSSPVQRVPESSTSVRSTPVAPSTPRMSTPAPAPAPPPQMHSAPAPSAPSAPSQPSVHVNPK